MPHGNLVSKRGVHGCRAAPLSRAITNDSAAVAGRGDERGRPLLHEHKICGKLFDPVMVCSECGEPLHAKQAHVHAGPGRDQAVG